MRLQDKVALITGAGSGIGRESALLFAREGASIVAVDLNSDTAVHVAEQIKGESGQAIAVQAEVRQLLIEPLGPVLPPLVIDEPLLGGIRRGGRSRGRIGGGPDEWWPR